MCFCGMGHLMLTHARLKQALLYDPEAGIFTWLILTGKARVGAHAGCMAKDGYFRIGIDGTTYLASRLAWFYMTGSWSAKEVDHADMDRANNRWANLRAATPFQNQGNRRAYKNNKSGVKGVHWHAPTGRWRAMIRFDGKSHHLGLFDVIADAQAAYGTAATKHFGDFARVA